MERNARFELTVHSFLPTMETGSGHETHLCIPLRPVMSMVLRDIPKLIDEATNGLDPVVREEIVELFSEFTRDESHAVLISSHIVSDLEKICDYVAFLREGQLLLCEEKDLLLARCGVVHGTAEQLSALEPAAVLGMRHTGYGAEALVIRKRVPAGMTISPVELEELFVFMAKSGLNAKNREGMQ